MIYIWREREHAQVLWKNVKGMKILLFWFCSVLLNSFFFICVRITLHQFPGEKGILELKKEGRSVCFSKMLMQSLGSHLSEETVIHLNICHFNLEFYLHFDNSSRHCHCWVLLQSCFMDIYICHMLLYL